MILGVGYTPFCKSLRLIFPVSGSVGMAGIGRGPGVEASMAEMPVALLQSGVCNEGQASQTCKPDKTK